MKRASRYLGRLLFVYALLFGCTLGASEQTSNCQPGEVKLIAVSVKHLNKREAFAMAPDCIKCFDTRIRLRLSIPKGCTLEVYAPFENSYPAGFDLFQDGGKTFWHFIDDRESSPGFDELKDRFGDKWKRIDDHKSLAWERGADLSRQKKVAYSVFVRCNSDQQPTEIISEWISPQTRHKESD